MEPFGPNGTDLLQNDHGSAPGRFQDIRRHRAKCSCDHRLHSAGSEERHPAMCFSWETSRGMRGGAFCEGPSSSSPVPFGPRVEWEGRELAPEKNKNDSPLPSPVLRSSRGSPGASCPWSSVSGPGYSLMSGSVTGSLQTLSAVSHSWLLILISREVEPVGGRYRDQLGGEEGGQDVDGAAESRRRRSQDRGNGTGCLAGRLLRSPPPLFSSTSSSSSSSSSSFRGLMLTLNKQQSGPVEISVLSPRVPTAEAKLLCLRVSWREYLAQANGLSSQRKRQAVVLPLRDDVAQGAVVGLGQAGPGQARFERDWGSKGPGSSLVP
ncbi:unnamed protein product [Pleuronectes platessa]|uniref:Uncharacterized protein n=1 Tax=Pleuronectes platessa TaxID=8262 RepID=A0A9N7U458_PLEPL|nr:unnamed protein product [Pleuronectes platessa]